MQMAQQHAWHSASAHYLLAIRSIINIGDEWGEMHLNINRGYLALGGRIPDPFNFLLCTLPVFSKFPQQVLWNQKEKGVTEKECLVNY